MGAKVEYTGEMSPIVFAWVCFAGFSVPAALIVWLDGDSATVPVSDPRRASKEDR